MRAPTNRAIVFAGCILAIGCGNRRFLPEDEGHVPIPPGATPVASVAAPAPRPAPPTTADVGVRAEPVSFAPIAHTADGSVVTINTVGEEVEISPFTHRRRHGEMRGLGTGFVVDRDGVVLTNNHVVQGAELIQVKLFDDREFPGKVVGTDPVTDIAVVRIDAKDLKPLVLGDSDALDVGDWVVAIGNPFGLSHTVSAGIVSAKGRTRQDVPLDQGGYYDFLQTDASINPGNSGGPLLNLKGEVVGINTAIRGDAQGIGFAIPINMVKQLLPMLLRDGHVTRSALGIRIVDVHQLTSDDRKALGFPEGNRLSGAIIEYVEPGGAADRSGLQPGDLILAFEGQTIDRSAQLQWLASTAGVGRSVTIHVQRAAARFETKVTLGQLDDTPSGRR
ncbi:MAG: trypsin-like peptidase domain-containing protein [Polyangiaceae bacterium]|jgi:serine protease Do